MIFTVQQGRLPTGMSLDSGNVVGTPAAPGAYSFSIAIGAVNGYQMIPVHRMPESSYITVMVVNP